MQSGTVTSGYQNPQIVQPGIQQNNNIQPKPTVTIQPQVTEEPIENKSIPVISAPVAVNSDEANRVSNTIN